MSANVIRVRYDLYVMEVTRHTNRKVIATYCWDCLAESKTNKEHLEYKPFPTISSIRICSKCGAMTPSAISNAFSININRLISLVERGTLYDRDDLPKPIKFVANSSTLLAMKGSLKNGKTGRYR